MRRLASLAESAYYRATFQRGKQRWRLRAGVFAEPCDTKSRRTRRSGCVNACRVCQYLGAGSGTVNAIFARDAVTVSSSLTDYVSRADSGSVMHRRFCAKCGTPIFSEAEPRPH